MILALQETVIKITQQAHLPIRLPKVQVLSRHKLSHPRKQTIIFKNQK